MTPDKYHIKCNYKIMTNIDEINLPLHQLYSLHSGLQNHTRKSKIQIMCFKQNTCILMIYYLIKIKGNV